MLPLLVCGCACVLACLCACVPVCLLGVTADNSNIDSAMVEAETGYRPVDLYWLYDSITDFARQDIETYWLDGGDVGTEEEEASAGGESLSQQMF